MQNDHDTNMGWWTDKPERSDRGSSFAPLRAPSKRPEERVWIKVAIILMVMGVFGFSLLRLVGLLV